MEKTLIFTFLAATFLFLGCETDDRPEEVMGLRPIYGTAADLEIRSLPAQEICQPGKIYTYGHYLLINELHQGIHIIDNTDPSAPVNKSFIKIVGNVDMAVKDGFLYADHLTSMVVFDMTDPSRAKFVTSVEKAFSNGKNQYPAQTGVPFECVDPEKGPVIGWAEALLSNPQCFR